MRIEDEGLAELGDESYSGKSDVSSHHSIPSDNAVPLVAISADTTMVTVRSSE